MQNEILEKAAAVLWGPFTLLLLIIFGGFLVIKSKMRFIMAMPKAVKNAFSAEKCGEISSLMVLSNSLAATMGTGNIVGVAAAILSGGAGALFWMQIAALCGMMIKFSEAALAIKYRSLGAGPMGYLSRIKLLGKPLAVAFAVCCAAAALGSGCVTQSNSAAQALELFSIPPVWCALVFGVVSWFAAGGGIKGIMRFSSVLILVITIGYITMSLIVIIKFKDSLPLVFKGILREAFCIKAVCGGAAGHTIKEAIRFGLSRGIFSNEAGMGSSAIGYSLLKSDNAAEQGMLSIAEVFADTVICCSLTGLVLLLSGANFISENGALAAINAFSVSLGEGYGKLCAAFIALFAIASVCGWYIYGVKALQFLMPKSKKAEKVYRFIYALCSALGAAAAADTIWLLSDVLTGSMMIINLFGLLLLHEDIAEIISKKL